MLKKVSLFISVILLMLLSTGCMSGMISDGVRQSIENTAVGGEFLIQDNPKAGDYAVYKSVNISYSVYAGKNIESYTENLIRYEVVSVDDKGVVVKCTSMPVNSESQVDGKTQFSATKDDMVERIGIPVTEYYLDKKGTILKVLYKNDKLGINTVFKQARPGEYGYIKYTPLDNNIEEIKTKAGVFKSSPIGYSLQNSTVVMGNYIKSYSENITYINPKISFKKVASLTMTLTNPSSEISRVKEELLQNLMKNNPQLGRRVVAEDLSQNGASAVKDITTLTIEVPVELVKK